MIVSFEERTTVQLEKNCTETKSDAGELSARLANFDNRLEKN